MSTVIGVLMGAIAAYYGGWVDEVLMRIMEFFQIVPGFVLAVVLIAIFTPSLVTSFLLLASSAGLQWRGRSGLSSCHCGLGSL
jgi:peptide/nickel transport system permease protein